MLKNRIHQMILGRTSLTMWSGHLRVYSLRGYNCVNFLGEFLKELVQIVMRWDCSVQESIVGQTILSEITSILKTPTYMISISQFL